jgi:hypothetical protein
MTDKRCPRCDTNKTYPEFRKNRSAKDGYDTYCKVCRKGMADPEYHKRYFQTHRKEFKVYAEKCNDKFGEKHKANKRQSYLDNREAILLEKKKYYLENKESILEYKSSYQKANRYKKNAIEAKRHTSKLKRTPLWLTKDQLDQIEHFYWLSRDLYNVTGQKYNVDHIVPLQGKGVCGLHVPWNLQVLPVDINIAKGNKFDGWS